MMFLKWLAPGLGIKRWFIISFFGLFFAAEGLAIAQGAELASTIEQPVRNLLNNYIGIVSDLMVGTVVIVVGLSIALYGFGRMIRNIVAGLMPETGSHLGQVLLQKVRLKRGPKIVALGGGTGLSMLLRSLKESTANITAIVAVTDDGGSSGRLRGELGMLAPGDIRNCLVALADTENAMEKLFMYRFPDHAELAGHSLGNLLLAGLTETTGNFASAVQEASRVLAIQGKVLPATLDNVVLHAEMEDGRIVEGETALVKDEGKIKKVFLHPAGCKPLDEALDAIKSADAIVLGPGSLYTSVIPNLLVPGIVDALKNSKAKVYYICNIMTQPGETDGYKVSQHLQAIYDHCGEDIIDKVIVNTEEISKKLQKKYKEEGSEPVVYDAAGVAAFNVEVIERKLASQHDLARHDGSKLTLALYRDILKEQKNLFHVSLFD